MGLWFTVHWHGVVVHSALAWGCCSHCTVLQVSERDAAMINEGDVEEGRTQQTEEPDTPPEEVAEMSSLMPPKPNQRRADY
jgi:hypothetical protein